MKSYRKLQTLKKSANIDIDKLIRTRRKTIGLEINNRLELIVRAPYHVSMSEIEEIVRKKSRWINKTREKLKKYNKTNCPKSFNIGETFYLKGEELILSSIVTGKEKIELRNNKIILYKMSNSNVKTIFIEWYKKQSKDFINARLHYYSNQLSLYPSSIRITSANKRWGSCSGKNSINFSYKLIMTPVKIIDYVIVHELIHILVKNHSKEFWKKVENIMPDYKERRKWLKENGHLFCL